MTRPYLPAWAERGPQRNAALHQRPRWKTQQEPLGGSEVSLPVSSPCRVIIGSPLSLFPFVTGASQCKSMSLQCSSYIMRERQKRKEAALTHVVYCSVSVLKISLQRDLGRFWKYTHTHIFLDCMYGSFQAACIDHINSYICLHKCEKEVRL